MGTRPSHRRRTFRTGLAATAAGILVAVTGLVAAPASAGQGQGQGQGTAERGSVTICHRTNAPDNPYTKNRVSYRSTDGAIVGNDHVSHGGPAFDYTADPADADYPYTTPRDGDQWGDIIPPYEWDGGSYPGSLAWQIGGAAILEADCTGGSDVDEVDLCEDGTEAGDDGICDETIVDVCPDVDGIQTDPADCATGGDDVCPDVDGIQTDPADCATGGDDDVCPDVDGIQTDPVDCAPGDDDACPNLDGVQAEGPCGPPADACPEIPGNQAEGPCEEPVVDACHEVDGIQESADECVAVLIPPVVIENLPPQAEAPEVAPIEIPAKVPAETPATPRRPTQVAGIQVLPATAAAQELPRTGVDTGTLVQLGLGLVLAGAGAMVAARRPQEAMAG